MVACVFVKIVLRDLAELPADVVWDMFYDLGLGVGGGEVLVEEAFVEGEDAFNFDAEGDREGGVDHVCGVLWIVVEIVLIVDDVQDECARPWNVQFGMYRWRMDVVAAWRSVSKRHNSTQSPRRRVTQRKIFHGCQSAYRITYRISKTVSNPYPRIFNIVQQLW